MVGARLRTLPAAVVPVAVGTGVAGGDGPVIWWRVAAAMVTALAIQVGTNYANDHSDGVRGTDDVRAGPVRLVASGLATARSVLIASIISFAVAAIAGLALAAVTSWWLLLVGAACIAAGWLYTGGPKPYGYYGFGEVFVFVFFGLVATAGSAYVQEEQLTGLMLLAGVPVGVLATALLVVNNLRDIPTDDAAGKHTLAVRLGDRATRTLYRALIAGAFAGALLLAGAGRPWSLLALGAVPLAAPVLRSVSSGARGPALIPVLQQTARLQLVFGALLTVGLWLG